MQYTRSQAHQNEKGCYYKIKSQVSKLIMRRPYLFIFKGHDNQLCN